jgi:hypothetical protein
MCNLYSITTNDDDVIVHQYSERRRYRRSHGSSAHPPARARIAGRMIVLIQLVIAALRESPVGPSRHIAMPRNLGRYRRIAEVQARPSITDGDALDPTKTFRAQIPTMFQC